MKNKIWLQRVLVLGLVISSCFVRDVKAIPRGSRSVKGSVTKTTTGTATGTSTAAATAAATPTPIPIPAPSAPPMDFDVESIVRTILVSDIPKMEQLYAQHKDKFSREQREAIELAHKEKQLAQVRVQTLEQRVDQLIRGLQYQKMQEESQQEKPKITGTARERTDYWGSLFDYEGLLSKMMPNKWTPGNVLAAVTAAVGTTAATVLYWPLISVYLTGMSLGGLGAMYLGVSRGLDCLQKGACTIDKAIEMVKEPIEQKINDSALYPTLDAQINAIEYGDFINLAQLKGNDKEVVNQAFLRLIQEIKDKKALIFNNDHNEKIRQEHINSLIEEIRISHQEVLNNAQLYVESLETNFPDILRYQAVISEYLRAKEKIAQVEAGEQAKIAQIEAQKRTQETGTTTQPTGDPQSLQIPPTGQTGAPTGIPPASQPTQQQAQQPAVTTQASGIYPTLEQLAALRNKHHHRLQLPQCQLELNNLHGCHRSGNSNNKTQVATLNFIE